MRDPNRNAAWGRILFDELYRSGVRHVCVSPGSRSTPLTLAAASHEGLQTHVLVDERVAGFFALGIARITGAPAVLVCTSGSAGAHYLPAVIEANEANIPMIVLTADRPAELMNAGAGQTIDQIHLLGRQVRTFVQADLPTMEALSLRHLRASANRLVAIAQGLLAGSAGPVHMNLPFREPLAPVVVQDDIPDTLREDPAMLGRADGAPWIAYQAPRALLPNEDVVDALARALDGAQRPILVCGPTNAAVTGLDALLVLAKERGIPLFADPASQLRWRAGACSCVVTTYDAWFRSAEVREQLAPDLVVRFGAQPTSKVYRFWREAHPEVREVLVEETGALLEPTQWSCEVLVADAGALARSLCARTTRDHGAGVWSSMWRQLEASARVWRATDVPVWEGAVARCVAEHMREGDALFLASSMPIRDMDAFGGTHNVNVPVIANRGANGIDGLISTALGVAATGRSVTAVIGDVASLHDVGGWLAAHQQELHATIVVVNNGGGGIFSYLPIAKYPEHFERMFQTPHEVVLEDIARAYGVRYEHVDEVSALASALEASRVAGGVCLVEVTVSLEHNLQMHARAWEEIGASFSEVLS